MRLFLGLYAHSYVSVHFYDICFHRKQTHTSQSKFKPFSFETVFSLLIYLLLSSLLKVSENFLIFLFIELIFEKIFFY